MSDRTTRGSTAFARRLLQAISEADERMGEFQDLVTRQAGKVNRIASPAGVVHMLVSNNVLARVDINGPWLQETADSAIEKELAEVLKSALPGFSHQAKQAAAAITPVSVLLAAASRPADLLRQLGLTS